MSEFLSTVIKSCRANFGVKWQVFFSTSIFVQKCQFWAKNNWSSVRNVDFLKLLCNTTENEYLIGKHVFFSEYFDFLCECLYTLRNCQNLIKTSIFLWKCLFVYVLIFIRVFLLLEKLVFWFKIWFYSMIFWKKCHFPSKIYISGGINFFGEIEQFFEKRC